MIGERANRATVDGINAIVMDSEYITHVNEISTVHMGPDFVLANISLDISDDVVSGSIKQIVTEFSNRIKESYPIVKRVFIEFESREKHTMGVAQK